MKVSDHKNVLVTPLNWGLGHATRIIPVINQLIALNYTIFLAGEGRALKVLEQTFPDLPLLDLPGFNVKYSTSTNQLWQLFKQVPSFLFWKMKEKRITKHLVKKWDIHLIISDNRYGVRAKNIPSIILTHQLSPKLGGVFAFMERPVSFIIKHWISKFHQCWIPDNRKPQKSLAGELISSYELTSNSRKIGILSRCYPIQNRAKETIDILCIVSGPEPQRSLFEEILIRKFSSTQLKIAILRGTPDSSLIPQEKDNNIVFYNHCTAEKQSQLIHQSKVIICRSGYSSLMDLFAMGRKALLIPTPGQPEQEYLARHMHKNFGFSFTSQNSFLSLSIADILSTPSKQKHHFANTSINSSLTLLQTKR
ncbi:glycosyltransferase [Marinilabiliaceae bacterium JC017]|nr:glycosyltransferase [Marinilabiliaceae bacterium JC017]